MKRADDAVPGGESDRFFELSLDLMCVATPEGYFRRLNPAFEKTLGYAKEDLLTTPFISFVHPDDRAKTVRALSLLEEGKPLVDFENRYRCSDGHFRALLWKAAPVDGLYYATARDITDMKEAVEALKDSEAMFARAFHLSPDLVLIIRSSDTVILQANEAACRFFGQATEDLVGHPVPLFTKWANPDDEAEFRDRLTRFGECRGMEASFHLADGLDVELELFSRMLTIRDVACTMTIFRDVTERKRAEAAAARLAAIVQSSGDAIIGTDMNAVVTSWNVGAEGVFGYSAGEMIGSSSLRLIPPERHHEEGIMLDRISRGEIIKHFETVRLRRDGSPIDVSITVSAIRDRLGHIVGASKVARDVTERRRAAQVIEELNATLEARVLERTKALEQANRELEAFSYSVSHDLRAPLRGIDSFSRIVIEDYADRLDDEGRRQLNVIRGETQRMGRLIDELLSFSRLGRQELQMTRIDMTRLVRAVAAELQAAASPVLHVVQVDALPPASGDRALIRQVVINLLGNAMKFSSTSESPGVIVTGDVVDGMSTYRVTDNGVGFDPRFSAKLFRVFQRLHSEGEFEGTGVGLAIVQRIIQRHGGAVGAEGALGRGATFTFTLPASPAPPRAPTCSSSEPMNRVEILFVEDNPRDAEITLRALKKHNLGNHLVHVRDGQEALDWLFGTGPHAGRDPADRPKVVLLDLKLPKLDGIEVLRAIRADPRLRRLPVVVLTSSREQQDLISTYDLGVNSYIVKPVDFEKFSAAVVQAGHYWVLFNQDPQ